MKPRSINGAVVFRLCVSLGLTCCLTHGCKLQALPPWPLSRSTTAEASNNNPTVRKRSYFPCSAGIRNIAGLSLNFSDSQLRDCIQLEAASRGLEDGWYYGQEPRLFKSLYEFTSPQMKAAFAVAYLRMLSDEGEDMIRDWQSYVPYSKRSLFARKWWNDNCQEFRKQNAKMKVVWIHEALLDSAELVWRRAEKITQGELSSSQQLAHDEEQRLVFNWAENEQSFGSLSTQPRPAD